MTELPKGLTRPGAALGSPSYMPPEQIRGQAVDERAEPIGFTLRVERETLRSATNIDKLQEALARALSRPVCLQVEAGAVDDSPARREAAERSLRQAEAEQIIHDDPLVQALMAQYKTARIVPGSVKPH